MVRVADGVQTTTTTTTTSMGMRVGRHGVLFLVVVVRKQERGGDFCAFPITRWLPSEKILEMNDGPFCFVFSLGFQNWKLAL